MSADTPPLRPPSVLAPLLPIKDPLVAELLLVAKRFLLSSLAETRDLLADLGAPSAGS